MEASIIQDHDNMINDNIGNKRSDIITLAKGAEVDTYVPQVHVYNMIHIYVMNRKTGCRVQGRVNTI